MKNKKRISLVWMITLIISIVSILSISVSPQNEFSMELTSRTGNFSFSAPENVSRFMALESLITAEAEIKSMQDYDLPTNYLNDILLLGKRSYIGEKFSYLKQDLEKEEDRKKISYLEGLQTLSFATPGHEIEYQNLSKVLFLTGLISFRKDQAFRILDYLPVVEEKENLFTEKGVNTTDGMNQLILARTAFKEERYDEAESLLNQADSLLESAYFEHQRSTAILSIGKNFFIRYWWQIILILVIIAVLFRPVFRKARRSMAASKLERMKLEFDTLQESLRKAQEERFIE
ncbi:MAG: hypothetical protein KKE20_05145, partial [Nanoarchaeota archaeon]|nr:hypothetical protein [Nanoarchaeota archaeon]